MRTRRVKRSGQERMKSGWKESRSDYGTLMRLHCMTSCLSYFITYRFITAETDIYLSYLDGNLANERIRISERSKDHWKRKLNGF